MWELRVRLGSEERVVAKFDPGDRQSRFEKGLHNASGGPLVAVVGMAILLAVLVVSVLWERGVEPSAEGTAADTPAAAADE